MITITVSDNDWVRYTDKYENLMWAISRRISGDRVIADLETNYADLCVAALDSIRGFHKKTGEDFSQMMDNILFDKYTKTVLWNYKNKKGNYLKKRYALNSSSVEFDSSYAPADTKVLGSYNGYMESLLNKCEKIPKSIIDEVCKNPDTIEDCMDLIADCFEEG
tara:strand:- start:175 stop:666 length:492 start_codon:yes stop_codon:yes gene_type:complete